MMMSMHRVMMICIVGRIAMMCRMRIHSMMTRRLCRMMTV
jgi:hypothetical protein